MTNKKSIILLVVSVVFFVFTQEVYAKRLLPRVAKLNNSTPVDIQTKTTHSDKTSISVKFRSDRRAIIVNFSDLDSASNVSYVLSYETRGTTQGASGSINLEQGNSQERELLLGTCSHGVCLYDSNITNAKFSVTTTLKNGKKYIKPFRLKV